LDQQKESIQARPLNQFLQEGKQYIGDGSDLITAMTSCTMSFEKNGTLYNLILTPDPKGGVIVCWPGNATYRWYPSGQYGSGGIKFLHGDDGLDNEGVDATTILFQLESVDIWAVV
tara:strand:- start:500 stop:847 length:348 start_codon:yes stop_codon:yes gene_type:complete